MGWRHERATGHEYLDFVDRFVKAVKQELPQTCLQWEDFSTPHARPLLERYQNELLTFNDDVQGTAAVVLGAVTGASKVAGKRRLIGGTSPAVVVGSRVRINGEFHGNRDLRREISEGCYDRRGSVGETMTRRTR